MRHLLFLPALLCLGQLKAQFNVVHTGASGTSLEDIHFPTAGTGYAAGKNGAVYKSTDGGANWSALSTGSGAWLFGVHFVDANLGFASGSAATVLRTVDGGANWTPLTLPFTECVYQVQAITTDLIYAAGWGGYFFRSVNGGDDWVISSIDPNWQGWVFGMHFSDALNGWVAEADGRIYRTTNGGIDWSERNTTTGNTLRGISMGDASTGYAAGFFGTVQKTIDGGANWVTVSTGYPGDSYYGAHFTDEDNGVICGGYYASGMWNGVIMRTSNGGQTWQRVHSGGQVLNGITVNNGSIFAVGVNEVVLSNLVVTGVSEIGPADRLELFPNPASGTVTVVAPAGSTIAIHDATGRVVHAGTATSVLQSMDVGSWAPGSYVVTASSASMIAKSVLIVAH